MENCSRFLVTITFIFYEKTKTTDTAGHVTSFPWSILSQTITLDQSAREDLAQLL